MKRKEFLQLDGNGGITSDHLDSMRDLAQKHGLDMDKANTATTAAALRNYFEANPDTEPTEETAKVVAEAPSDAKPPVKKVKPRFKLSHKDRRDAITIAKAVLDKKDAPGWNAFWRAGQEVRKFHMDKNLGDEVKSIVGTATREKIVAEDLWAVARLVGLETARTWYTDGFGEYSAQKTFDYWLPKWEMTMRAEQASRAYYAKAEQAFDGRMDRDEERELARAVKDDAGDTETPLGYYIGAVKRLRYQLRRAWRKAKVANDRLFDSLVLAGVDFYLKYPNNLRDDSHPADLVKKNKAGVSCFPHTAAVLPETDEEPSEKMLIAALFRAQKDPSVAAKRRELMLEQAQMAPKSFNPMAEAWKKGKSQKGNRNRRR